MAPFTSTLVLVCSLFSITSASPSLLTRSIDVNGDYPPVSKSLQSVLEKDKKAYSYPTDFTQGIFPLPLHSHNDYWRPVPLYTALSYGAVSIEADVFLYQGELYIGHHREALSTERTFKSLYVDPLLDVLKQMNPPSKFGDYPAINGVWDTASTQTLYLFVDVKTGGEETWSAVLKAVEPLKQKNYLSVANATHFISGPITIIGTGNTPRSVVESTIPRHFFYDAPLATLNSSVNANITALVSPIASTNFQVALGPVTAKTGLNETQLAALRSQVGIATRRGIKTRYWNQPSWPIGMRNEIWRQLVAEGVGLLNVDDLKSASGLGYDW